MKTNGLRNKKPDASVRHLSNPKYSVESLAELKRCIEYDQGTGGLVWKVHRGRCKRGSKAGTESNGYINVKFYGFLYKAHILCWALHCGEWPKSILDHKDGDGTNNRIENLRETTQCGNMQNAVVSVRNKSGCPGVYYCRADRLWKARIGLNKKVYSLGCFKDFDSAKEAYVSAKEKLHTESPEIRWNRSAAELVKMSVVHPRITREQRNSRVLAMRNGGLTFQAIADEHGLSRQGIQQICKRAATNLYTSAATCEQIEEK